MLLLSFRLICLKLWSAKSYSVAVVDVSRIWPTAITCHTVRNLTDTSYPDALTHQLTSYENKDPQDCRRHH